MLDFFARPYWLLIWPFLAWWLLACSSSPTRWRLPTALAPRLLKGGATSAKPPSWSQGLLPQRLFTASAASAGHRLWALLTSALLTLALAGIGWHPGEHWQPRDQALLLIMQELSDEPHLNTSQRRILPLLQSRQQGESALIVFTAQAHLASPATPDHAAVIHLYSLLHPSVLPEARANPSVALEGTLQLARSVTSHRPADWLLSTASAPSPHQLSRLSLPAGVELHWLLEAEPSPALLAAAPDQCHFYGPSALPRFTAQDRQDRLLQDAVLFQEQSHWALLLALLLIGTRWALSCGRFTPWFVLLLCLPMAEVSLAQAHALRDQEAQAHQLFAQERYAAAASAFIQLITAQDPDALADQALSITAQRWAYNAGTSWLMAGEPEQAQHWLNKAQELDFLPVCVHSQLAQRLSAHPLEAPAISFEAALTQCLGGHSAEQQAGQGEGEGQDFAQHRAATQDSASTGSETAASTRWTASRRSNSSPLDEAGQQRLDQLESDPWRLLRRLFREESAP